MAGSRIPYVFRVGFPESTGFTLTLKKWAYNLSGFNKLGLMRDDVLMETSDVVEAVKRLPPKLYDERQFRISRALLLSMQKTILPKEQWTKPEEDVRYLMPYIEEIRKEKAEKAEWIKATRCKRRFHRGDGTGAELRDR